jgi:hypothetical protein
VDVIQSSGKRNTVEQAAGEYELQQYIQARHRWTLQTLQSVDWDAYNSTLRSLESNTQVFVTKLSYRWLPTRAHEAKMDEALDERCSCGEIETQDHMWTCKEMRPKRINFLAELDCWATKHHTHEPLQRSILESFTKWANRSQSGLLAKEYKIGMEKVMRGYIPAYWGQSQETHRQSIQINTTGAIWANFCGRFNITIGKTAAKPNTSRQLKRRPTKRNTRAARFASKNHTPYTN